MVKFRGAPVFLAWFCLIFGLIYYGVGSIFLSAYADELQAVSTGLRVVFWFFFRGLAIVLASKPDILLLDEPFGDLDPITLRTVSNSLKINITTSQIWNSMQLQPVMNWISVEEL
mgnify:CR=1 FL=1